MINRKFRNKEEINGFYLLMVANIERMLKSGKVVWINNREMIRKI